MIRSKFMERVFFFMAVVGVLQACAALGGVKSFGPLDLLLASALLFAGLGFTSRHLRLRGEFLRETKGSWHNGL